MAIAHTEQENRRATMKDVARRAGVTIGTVSHVINGTAPISEETTARVREAIRELNYVPNLAARHMRRKEKRQIRGHRPDSHSARWKRRPPNGRSDDGVAGGQRHNGHATTMRP